MITLPLGLVSFVIVIILTMGHAKASDYLVVHSFIIVFGGAIAVTMICTPMGVLATLMHNVRSLFKNRRTIALVKPELMKLAENRNGLKSSTDPLVQYAINLWEKGTDSGTFQALISQYRDKLEHEEVEAIAALHAMAKYPPALGMLGTVIGMISLFASLGGSDKSGLGPALATAMTATFYGLILANGVLAPMADRLVVEAIYRKQYSGYIYEILTLINRREPVSMIEEEISVREAA